MNPEAEKMNMPPQGEGTDTLEKVVPKEAGSEEKKSTGKWLEKARVEAQKFINEHFKGHAVERPKEPAGVTKEKIKRAALKGLYSASNIFGIKAAIEVARLVSQEYHERVEEKELTEAFKSGLEKGALPEEKNLDETVERKEALPTKHHEAFQKLSAKIEGSKFLKAEKKQEFINELNSLKEKFLNQVESNEKELVKEVGNLVKKKVESEMKTWMVLKDVALAVSGFSAIEALVAGAHIAEAVFTTFEVGKETGTKGPERLKKTVEKVEVAEQMIDEMTEEFIEIQKSSDFWKYFKATGKKKVIAEAA